MPVSNDRLAPPQPVLLAAKLARPRLPAGLVVRQRLLSDLDAAYSHRLTLLSAAAGWGKTTALSAWVADQPHAVAWVSLDELDNTPARFWTAIIAALRTHVPTVGATALAMLHSPEPPPLSTFVTVLLNELAAMPDPAPMLLVLDDYHLISDSAIHEGVTFLIDHLPAHLHMMIATRIDPDLPLARWRVRGDLAEIRAADLRFTGAEAASFFTQALGAALADDDVQRLEQRTEGWPAGLQLAALALRQHTDRSAFVQLFTGSHRYLLDYMQEEILQRQPLAVQRFLLHTAVLPRLNAQICAALMEDAASQDMLEWLERNNLFVVPLDEQRQWYRVHDLFREVLLARLHATEPQRVADLHQRAAQWYATQNELRQAIAHALAVTDFDFAAKLMVRASPEMWLRGEAQTVHAWISTLPDVIVWRHARWVLDAVLHLMQSVHGAVAEVYLGVQVQTEQTIVRMEALLRQPQAPTASMEEIALLKRRTRLLRLMMAHREIFTGGDSDHIKHIQRVADEATELGKNEDILWKQIGLGIRFGLIEAIQREGALLIPELLEAKQQAIAAGDRVATVGVMRLLAFAYVRAARPRNVEQECLQALSLVEQMGLQSATTAYLHYFLFGAYTAWYQLDKAAHSVHQLLSIAQAWQQADLLLAGYGALTWLELARGDHAAAEEALHKLEALIQRERFVIHAGAEVLARVSYWLATGDLDAARAWAQQVVLSSEAWNPNRKWEALQLSRVYLVQQHHSQALEVLNRFSAELDRPGDVDTTLEYLVLQALALQGGGQAAQAHVIMARLLALTAPENFIRVYLDAGEPMRQLLQSLVAPPHQQAALPTATDAFVAKLLAAFEQHMPLVRPGTPPLAEPLTPREEEVLRLLVSGASNHEIAAKLVISLATAKKHVSNVLGKLGVQNRVQAIARARDWPNLS